MSKLKPPTTVEKIAGNLRTESAMTMIGALSGSPIGALLPVLSNSIANNRFKVRISNALEEVSQILELHEEKIKNLTDNQFKLINESILAFFQTTDAEKIKYLKHAAINSLDASDVTSEEAIVLSRIIRDISAQEIKFLVKNYGYQKIRLGFASGDMPNNTLNVSANGDDELIVTGLMSLGLVIPAGPTIKDSGLMRFSNSVAKLLALLKSPST